MGVSQRTYGVLFAMTALGLMAGSLTNARLSHRGISHTRIIKAGMAVVVATAVVLLLLATTGLLRWWLLVPLVVLSHVGQGVVRPNASQGALEPMPDIAGVASAVLTGLQMLVGALASGIAAALFDGHTARAMTATMVLCSLGAAAVYALVVRPAERRGVAPRAAATPCTAEVVAA